MGGNAVDLPAVKWLMKHPKPWVLVSDLEFCGGVLGSEIVAHALVERAVARGELTVYRSLDAAYEAFGGKGDLGDAERAKYRKERSAAIAERAERRREREVNRAVADI
jgi:chaperone required for assembly of F1-ATPase